jgi:hypothetical protein
LGVLAGGGSAAQLRTYLTRPEPGAMASMQHPLFSPTDLAAMGDLWERRNERAHLEQVEAVGRYLSRLPVDVVEQMAATDGRLAETWAAWRRRQGSPMATAPAAPMVDPLAPPAFPDLPSFPPLRVVQTA